MASCHYTSSNAHSTCILGVLPSHMDALFRYIDYDEWLQFFAQDFNTSRASLSNTAGAPISPLRRPSCSVKCSTQLLWPLPCHPSATVVLSAVPFQTAAPSLIWWNPRWLRARLT